MYVPLDMDVIINDHLAEFKFCENVICVCVTNNDPKTISLTFTHISLLKRRKKNSWGSAWKLSTNIRGHYLFSQRLKTNELAQDGIDPNACKISLVNLKNKIQHQP